MPFLEHCQKAARRRNHVNQRYWSLSHVVCRPLPLSCPWSSETDLARHRLWSASRPCTNLLLLLHICMPLVCLCLSLPASPPLCLPAWPSIASAIHIRLHLALCAEPLRLHASPPTACRPPSPLFVGLGHAIQCLIPTHLYTPRRQHSSIAIPHNTTHHRPTLFPGPRKLYAQPRGTPSVAPSNPSQRSPAVCEARPASLPARRMRRRTPRSKDICHCNVP
jgi:hypothetical protein